VGSFSHFLVYLNTIIFLFYTELKCLLAPLLKTYPCEGAGYRYKYRTKVFLPKNEKQVASDEWDSELELVDNPRLTRHLTTQSSNVLPVRAFHNKPIARYLLPAIVLELVHIVTFEKTKSVAEFWNHLTELNLPEDNRDPLNPFDWCVALNPDASEEDFRARLRIPPKSITALQDYVNELQKRHSS
jgi:hypothetical protein